ncbi:GNAT family N-acetyltransferase [Tenacibaculum soleae]|uniref:Acetyltransferase n=1 Tax=Tenacibaculum soleae TaxID=447689 RepID=A0A1B9XX01_9FLAO|nr:GNAT family N-acetyltransferase [Tenacibaculum soleae]MDO6744755.1 GNAT family N-acetyltransferase [Tenacibaculum soleae]MDO6813443.1 GNAT family N-acetyltransferase [Tenacibaculum soleae]OCK42088.1 acetyltransferase [Tenacibaculum soleae]
MIKTRKATLIDLPILLEFEQALINFERPFDATLKDEKISYYDIKAMILSDEVAVIVAVDNEKVVGSGYGRIQEAKPYLKHQNMIYLGFMFVANSHRGKGINKLIIDDLYTWAISNNIYEVRLDVYADNPSAIRAYEKAGFRKHLLNMRKSLK